MSAGDAGTGATPEQIAEATERYYDLDPNDGRYPNSFESFTARNWAEALVPPGKVIADESDVVTAEQRAAAGRALAFVETDRAVTAGMENPRMNPQETRMLSDRCLSARNAITAADLALLRGLAGQP